MYVDGAKLASIGLRIRRGASYHGMALNVSLDLEPFERINVCGYRGLAVTRLADLGVASPSVDARGAGSDAAPVAAAGLARAASARDYSAINTDLQAVSSR